MINHNEKFRVTIIEYKGKRSVTHMGEFYSDDKNAAIARFNQASLNPKTRIVRMTESTGNGTYYKELCLFTNSVNPF